MWTAAGSRRLSVACFRSAPLVGAAAVTWSWGSSSRKDENNGIIWWGTTITTSNCESLNTNGGANNVAEKKMIRKRTTLQHAVASAARMSHRRFNTKLELSKIRSSEKEMLDRWERDEDGWRDLPSRAWPAYQPNPEQLKGIQAEVIKNGCGNDSSTDLCTELLFNMSTALVFYNIDAEAGLKQYESLAKQGHVDSMVACGIILIEGIGIPKPNEKRGIEWLQKAVDTSNSAQGYYELGTVLYTGIDGILEEDEDAAFELFSKAAEQGHIAGMYMMAECLLEGEGTDQNIGRAVPLFYEAAEQGHRFARQRVRELLARKEYTTTAN